MLGTASREIDRLRDQIERDNDRFDRLRATLDSLAYAAPEVRDARRHTVITVAQQIVRQREDEHAGY